MMHSTFRGDSIKSCIVLGQPITFVMVPRVARCAVDLRSRIETISVRNRAARCAYIRVRTCKVTHRSRNGGRAAFSINVYAGGEGSRISGQRDFVGGDYFDVTLDSNYVTIAAHNRNFAIESSLCCDSRHSTTVTWKDTGHKI